MGVVRRKGEWRLEKRDEGVYEITYDRMPQLRVVTNEYRYSGLNQSIFDTIPVREVQSYSEAEGLFEEKAHGPAPVGFEEAGATSALSADHDGVVVNGDGFEAIEEAPPGLIGFALVLVGGFVLYSLDYSIGSPGFFLGFGMLLGGIGIFAWGGFLFRFKGPSEAKDFLFTVSGESESRYQSNKSEKTPPLSQHKKDLLIEERAEFQCEWCGTEMRKLEVHHIVPRHEGGPNEARNLIVLCPNCHREDAELLSRSKLRRRVRYQMEDWDGF